MKFNETVNAKLLVISYRIHFNDSSAHLIVIIFYFFKYKFTNN